MKASLVVLGLIISISAMAVLAFGQVEFSFGEERAMERFERGIGGPWTGGDRYPGWQPFSFTKPEFSKMTTPVQKETDEPKLDLGGLALLGHVTIISGNLTVADSIEGGFTIPQRAGTYPIYGIVDEEEGLKALYIDLAADYKVA
ncbi:hypothetical protein P0O15_04540 [Methanotrichaceae archaeon Mx]|uniref:Uncharacterized protein n=2 Tax=Candidatus Methanocrinis natronophilus TaxID=3033396 RepID=A0ABT5X788_9EURY|nr:hypothetical protein [Candidatus Methanocrinis natronophilus]